MDELNKRDTEAYWNEQAAVHLAGRKIERACYMNKAEARAMGWNARSVVLELDNGAVVIVQSDDEGNDAGALLVLNKKAEIILPVI